MRKLPKRIENKIAQVLLETTKSRTKKHVRIEYWGGIKVIDFIVYGATSNDYGLIEVKLLDDSLELIERRLDEILETLKRI